MHQQVGVKLVGVLDRAEKLGARFRAAKIRADRFRDPQTVLDEDAGAVQISSIPFGFGKKRAVTDEPGATRPAGSKLRLNAGARTGLLLSTLLALLSFLTVLGALGAFSAALC